MFALHHIQKYLVIHYVLSFWIFSFFLIKSKEDKMQIKSVLLIMKYSSTLWHTARKENGMPQLSDWVDI